MLMRHAKALVLCLAFLLALSGCSYKLVASFDEGTQESILKCARLIDGFYTGLLEVPEGERAYEKFAPGYREIEVELKSLVFRNEVRALNRESTKQAQDVLELWQKYKSRHKDRDEYIDFNAISDYSRLKRLLKYALTTEEIKKDGEEDR